MNHPLISTRGNRFRGARPGIVLVAAGMLAIPRLAAQAPNGAWVYPSSSGNLLYQMDERGQRIADFSHCGYRTGTEPLPDVNRVIPQSRWVYVNPGDGDDTALIQSAVNTVKAMTPEANGWRGVVFLNAGEYQLASTVTIDASGIVLKGAGDSSTTGTRLRATDARQYALVNVTGSGSHATVSNTTRNLVQKLAPAGSRTFELDSTAGYAAGHTVRIKRPSTAEWIADIDMDQLGPQSGGEADDVPWTPGSKDLFFDRVITHIDGNWMTVDAPIPQSFESRYGGGQVWRYTWSGRIQQNGVEDVYGISNYASATDENHAWTFIRFSAAQHGWVRNIAAQHFGNNAVLLTGGAKWITVADSQCLDPISVITGGRRYSFSNEGAELTLFVNNYARKGRHDYVFGATVEGPNAFVQCKADTAYSDTGPHHRWSVGGLFDNLTINGNAIDAENRGNLGTGHGWAGAYMAVWNCTASSFRVRNPPTARNWLVGSTGSINASSVPVGADPPGTYDSSGTAGKEVHPRSLYFAQLQQRMKWPGSTFREVWSGDVDQHYSTGGTGNTAFCDPAWFAAVDALTPSIPTDSSFDLLTGNRRTAFTMDFTLAPGETVAAASLTMGLRAVGGLPDNDLLYVDSTSNPVSFASLGWTPVPATESGVRTTAIDPALLADGRLNLAIQDDCAIDFAVIHLQVARSGTPVRQVVLTPVADGYVRGGTYANGNFGTETTLATKDRSVTDVFREAFLRWDLSAVSGRVVDAKVRLAGTATSQAGNESAAALVSDDTWGETTLTYNNRPSSGNLFAQWLPVTGQPVEFSVLPLVLDTLGGDGKLSLKVFSTDDYGGAGNVGYASRENANSSVRPRLLLTLENNSPALSPLADRSIPVNTSTGAVSFTVDDADTGADSLSLAVSSSQPALVPASAITLAGSGQNRTLTVSPAANTLGIALITVTASDGSLSANSAFTLTVTGTAAETWRFTHFGTTSNSGDAADSADPDIDGWTNAQERAANSDPNDAASQPDNTAGVTRYWNASPLSKTWQTGAPDWNTAPLGGGVQGAWNPGDDAVFDRPDHYTITLNSPLAAGPLSLRAGDLDFAGTGSVATPSITIDAGATLTAAGDHLFRVGSTSLLLNGTIVPTAASGSADRLVTLQGSGQVVSGSLQVADGTFAGSFAGTSSLVKVGSGTLVLTGSSSSAGPVTIHAGTVRIGNGGTTGLLGNAPVAGAGTLEFHRSDAVTWGGSMAGAARLVKSGTNTLTVTGELDHAGGTVVSGGILQIGDGGPAGSLAGGTVTNSGTLRFNHSGLTTCSAVITGGTLSKLGTGTLVLTGNNNFGSGTFTLGGGSANVGYLRLAHPKALGNHTRIHLASSGATYSGLEVAGDHTFTCAIDTVGRSSSAGSVFLRNVSGFNTWAGDVTITGAGGSYEIESLAGELVVTGAIGVANIAIGTRNFGVKGPGDVTLAGPVTDVAATPIALTKTGPGTLRLNAPNSFTGAIQVAEGALLVNGSVTPAASVADGAVLGGSGTIGAAVLTGVSAASPAVISPGDSSVGTLTSSGTITFGPNSRYDWEIAGNDDEQAPLHDRLAAAHAAITATSARPWVIRVLPSGLVSLPAAVTVFPVLEASDLTGFDSSVILVDASAVQTFGGAWSVEFTGGTLGLRYTPPGFAGWITGFPGIENPSETADPDGDGWSNREEWVAGTDPTDATSRFQTLVTPGGLGFTRIPGRSYLVETSETLESWSFHEAVADGEGEITIPHPTPPGQIRFYRVRIVLAE